MVLKPQVVWRNKMTIRDLVEQGITIQGDKVIVEQWNNKKEDYDILYETKRDLLVGDCEEYADCDISYIYQSKNVLHIEIEGR